MTIRVGKVARIADLQETRQESLLAAIARSAEEMTSGRGWPDGIINLMEDLGRITGVSRVWIFQTIEVATDHVIQDYPFEWADSPEHQQLFQPVFNMFRTNIDNEDYRQMVESRKRGEWQSVITSELEDSTLKDSQVRQGILSMLTVPIMVEGEWWGTLGFDDCKRECWWSDTEIALLRTASYLISNAILRDRLMAKTKQFQILQAITESGAWEVDLKKGHFWCSPEILGKSVSISENMHLTLLSLLRRVHPHDRKELLKALREYLRIGEGAFRQDLRLATDCGYYTWLEAIGRITVDSRGRVEKIAGIAVNILKRKEEEEQLRREASKDPLTGIDNRAAFDRHYATVMNRSVATGESFSLLLMDLDNFKKINDTWGHDVGDNALRHWTEICRRNLRSGDVFARVGGEEFAILFSGASEQVGADIGERIRADLERSALVHGQESIPLTVSIGCAAYPAPVDVTSRSHFYRLADYALYVAKRSGRNRLVRLSSLEMEPGCGI